MFPTQAKYAFLFLRASGLLLFSLTTLPPAQADCGTTFTLTPQTISALKAAAPNGHEVELTVPLCEGNNVVPTAVVMTPISLLAPGYRRETTVFNGSRIPERRVDTCLRPYFFRGYYRVAGAATDLVAISLAEENCQQKELVDGFLARNYTWHVLHGTATQSTASSHGNIEATVRPLTEGELARFREVAGGCNVGTAAREMIEAENGSASAVSKQLILATEADYEYFQARRAEAGGTFGRILSIVNTLSAIYEREFGVRVFVSYQHAWGIPLDPYTDPVFPLSGLPYAHDESLNEFGREWRTNFSERSYDLAHLWSGKIAPTANITNLGISWVGRANVGGLCGVGQPRNFAMSLVTASATNPTTQRPFANLTSLADVGGITAHEVGHNLGAIHDESRGFIMHRFIEPVPRTNHFSPLSMSTTVERRANCLRALNSLIITEQPRDVVVQLAPTDVTFAVSGGNPVTGTNGVAFQWIKNGQVLSGATGSTLALRAVSLLDNSSQYAVELRRGGEVIRSRMVTLRVIDGPPAFSVEPENQRVSEGQLATFRAQAVGTDVRYQWHRVYTGSSRSNSETTRPIAGATGPMYSLSPTATSNGLVVFVVATSARGSTVSRRATLTVNSQPLPPPQDTPQILDQPEDIAVPCGRIAHFYVNAGGENLRYQWYRVSTNGEVVPAGGDTADFTLGSTSAAFRTAPVSGAFDGRRYFVTIANDFGAVESRRAELRVRGCGASVQRRGGRHGKSVRKRRGRRR